ncbi:hypothetical protein KBZ07_09695 [Cyanobium sp. BA20m-14]|uniref:hypothetical protein n=1 Tax=Cyanobium sp. BA20m-14 TaxID=2823703 RepID=UPI0020CD4C16|nr:hypothetical protein [Cyanobium sp. BA20m-14]MCP9913669.1 hypothetical protein [Cyanobium sp. BA20m-14]
MTGLNLSAAATWEAAGQDHGRQVDVNRMGMAIDRNLPRTALEGFTKAFRKRLKLPAEAASIPYRICQRQHHDCFETFLVSHR